MFDDLYRELDAHPGFSRSHSWRRGGLPGDALEAARADLAAKTEERERQIWKDEAEWYFRSLGPDATPEEIIDRVLGFIRDNRHEYLGPLGSHLLRVQGDLFDAVDEVLIGLGLEQLTSAQRIRMGIVLEEAAGISSDYILIDYDKGDKLFVPVYQMHLISKYNPPRNTHPK